MLLLENFIKQFIRYIEFFKPLAHKRISSYKLFSINLKQNSVTNGLLADFTTAFNYKKVRKQALIEHEQCLSTSNKDP